MAHRAGLAHIEGFSPEKSGERDLEVAAPLGLDLWIGLPEEEEFRYAPFVEFDPRMRAQLRARLAGRAGPASTGEYSAQHSLPARQSLRLCVRLSACHR